VEQVETLMKNEEEYHIYIAMNYCSKGSLEDVLHKCQQNQHSVPLSVRHKWILQICSALKYMHQNGLWHKDIKAENILFEDCQNDDEPLSIDMDTNQHCEYETYNIRLCDFGLTRFHNGEPVSNLGSPLYMAPEIADGTILDGNEKTDIWSLGIVILQLLMLVATENLPDVRTNIRKDKAWLHSFGMEQKFNPKLLRICSMCCQIEPDKRPSIEKIVSELNRTATANDDLDLDELCKISNSQMMSQMLSYSDNSPSSHTRTRSNISPRSPRTTAESIRSHLSRWGRNRAATSATPPKFGGSILSETSSRESSPKTLGFLSSLMSISAEKSDSDLEPYDDIELRMEELAEDIRKMVKKPMHLPFTEKQDSNTKTSTSTTEEKHQQSCVLM